MCEMTDDRTPLLFGRRKGKPLRSGQALQMQELLPRVRVDLARISTSAAPVGAVTQDLWLEIGFGGGEHLVADARAHPGVSFIGCEPFLNGVAKLLGQISAYDLENVRVHHGDAMDVLVALPDASLGRVNILYPDPWPKLRHRKRRFMSDATLAEIARVLKVGAQLRFATDIDDYAGWTLARVLRSPSFDWPVNAASDWLVPWDDWPGTRYEAKAFREGRTPVYLTFVRC
jgi:tRNA (guanine-N7-)-methyltransferase